VIGRVVWRSGLNSAATTARHEAAHHINNLTPYGGSPCGAVGKGRRCRGTAPPGPVKSGQAAGSRLDPTAAGRGQRQRHGGRAGLGGGQARALLSAAKRLAAALGVSLDVFPMPGQGVRTKVSRTGRPKKGGKGGGK
jgi:hypothetical protein